MALRFDDGVPDAELRYGILSGYPLEVCLAGVQSRKGKARFDMPWTETEDDEEFLTFIRNYRSVSRPIVMQLLAKYAGKKIYVFADRWDGMIFYAVCQKNEKSS